MLANAAARTLQGPKPEFQQGSIAADPDSTNPIIELVGDAAGEHALVLGSNGPELMCQLLRQGAIEVISLCQLDHPESETATLLIAPRISTPEQSAEAIAAARRALLPTGRIILGGVPARFAQAVRGALRKHGFCKQRSVAAHGLLFIRAELPMFGRAGDAWH